MLARRTSSTLALRLMVGAFALGLVAYGAYLLFAPGKPLSQDAPPPAGLITIKGEMVCLPHRNTSGPQTMECAFGLKDDQGRYFGLRDTDPYYQNVSSAPMGERVEVFGMFTPQADEKYQSIGIIEVHGIAPDTPVRMQFSGVFECLPHNDTSGQQTDECAYGIKADDGRHFALDFGPLESMEQYSRLQVGMRIRVEGPYVPIEAISSDRWMAYPITGILSVVSLELF